LFVWLVCSHFRSTSCRFFFFCGLRVFVCVCVLCYFFAYLVFGGWRAFGVRAVVCSRELFCIVVLGGYGVFFFLMFGVILCVVGCVWYVEMISCSVFFLATLLFAVVIFCLVWCAVVRQVCFSAGSFAIFLFWCSFLLLFVCVLRQMGLRWCLGFVCVIGCWIVFLLVVARRWVFRVTAWQLRTWLWVLGWSHRIWVWAIVVVLTVLCGWWS